MSTRIVSLNIDTIIAAMEARPETKARHAAWEWLAEQSAVTFDGDVLLVPSSELANVTYRTTLTSCSCPARKPCKHMEAAQIVAAAIAEDAAYDLAADNALWEETYNASTAQYHALAHHEATETVHVARVERKRRAYAAIAECFN